MEASCLVSDGQSDRQLRSSHHCWQSLLYSCVQTVFVIIFNCSLSECLGLSLVSVTMKHLAWVGESLRAWRLTTIALSLLRERGALLAMAQLRYEYLSTGNPPFEQGHPPKVRARLAPRGLEPLSECLVEYGIDTGVKYPIHLIPTSDRQHVPGVHRCLQGSRTFLHIGRGKQLHSTCACP